MNSFEVIRDIHGPGPLSGIAFVKNKASRESYKLSDGVTNSII